RASVALEQRHVLGLLSRVGGEVLVRAELGRIHEDRRDRSVGLTHGPLHERHVTGVQRTHRRDQADDARARAPRADIGDRTQDFQRAREEMYAGTVAIGGRSVAMMSCISRCSFPPSSGVMSLMDEFASSQSRSPCASPTRRSATCRISKLILDNASSVWFRWMR